MTPEDFIRTAKAKIAPDPFDRLAPMLRLPSEDDDCRFDCHVHIFDIERVPSLLQNIIGNPKKLKKEFDIVGEYILDDILSLRISSGNFLFRVLNSFGKLRKYR